MNPLDPYSDPGLVQARNEASTAMSNYGTAKANTISMPDMLKKALDQKFSQDPNNPLYQQQTDAYQEYDTAANLGYQAVLPQNNNGMIFSPTSQAEQINARRGSAIAKLSGINQRIAGGFSGIENIIKEATNTYKAQETVAQFKSEGARQKYLDLLDEIAKKTAAAQDLRDFEFKKSTDARDFAESVRQFNVSQAGGGTAGERSRNQALASLQREVAAGGTFRDLYPRYSSVLDEYEIRNVYNQGPVAKKWGPAKEQYGDLQKLLKPAVKELDDDAKKSLESFSKGVDRLEAQYKALTPADKLSAIIPGSDRVNAKLSAINTLKTTLGYDLARLRDKGVLNKQDVDYAINSLGKINATNASALASINEVREYINRKLGVKTKEKDWNKLLKEAGL